MRPACPPTVPARPSQATSITPRWAGDPIVAAGPVANFLLAIVIFAASFAIVGMPISSPVIEEVRPGSAAEEAGIQPGDRITSIQGNEITSFTQIQRLVADRGRPGTGDHAGARRTSEMALTVTPQVTEVPEAFGGTIRIGLLGMSRDVSQDLVYERKGPIEAVGLGVARPISSSSARLPMCRA
jgi:regulator of sigma E protease